MYRDEDDLSKAQLGLLRIKELAVAVELGFRLEMPDSAKAKANQNPKAR